MKRREFITIVGAAAVTWPVVARGQQPARLPTIGFLGQSTALFESQRVGPFVRRLRELGWTDGSNVTIDFRWAESRSEKFAEIASEFVRHKVDVIVTQGPGAAAAKQATSSIPIVFAVSNDPVGDALVASLSRPGGNLTGLSLQQNDLAGKRLELLGEILPGLRRVAAMANVGNRGYSSGALEMDEVQKLAGPLGVEVTKLPIRRAEDIAPAFEAIKDRTDALYVVGDPMMTQYRTRINTLALGAKLPSIYSNREVVEAGGLVSYGPYLSDLYRRAADYVDKILRGAKPADLPVEQPTKFYLVINLTTAKAIGLVVPPALLARADEAIE
jgi:putative ABC transport system substrate-binding protein